MKKYRLRGLAEGLSGKSSIVAASLEDVFLSCPALAAARHKLTVQGDLISGFAPCDG